LGKRSSAWERAIVLYQTLEGKKEIIRMRDIGNASEGKDKNSAKRKIENVESLDLYRTLSRLSSGGESSHSREAGSLSEALHLGETTSVRDISWNTAQKSDIPEGVIRGMLELYNEVAQEYSDFTKSKLCSIVLEDKEISSRLEKFYENVEDCHAICMEAGEEKRSLVKPYAELSGAISEYYDKLRTYMNAELKKLTSSEESTSEKVLHIPLLDCSKSVETYICKNIEKIISNENIDDEDCFRRSRIIDATIELNDTKIVPDLMNVLPNEQVNIYVRRGIAKAIAVLGTGEAVPQLFQMFHDEKIGRYVRGGIAKAIAILGKEEDARELFQMIPDEQIDIFVRDHIIEAIGVSGKKGFLPELFDMLGNEEIDLNVREKIPYAIVALGGKEVVSALFNALRNESHLFVCYHIAEAILGLHDKDSALKLVTMLQEKEIDVDKKCYIADAFEYFKAPKVKGGEEVITALGKVRADKQTNQYLRKRMDEAFKGLKR
jgi:hypothetical protein